MKRILLFLWLIACFGVLALALMRRADRDLDIVCTYFMFFLTFPAGFAVAFFFSFVSHFASGPGGFAFVLMSWPLFVITGYLQWFVFLPWVFRKAKGLRPESKT